MATIYIDPTHGSAGSGTLSDPFQSWASVTWVAGNVYLQKQGTTFVGTISVTTTGTSENRIYLGTYEPITGAIIENSDEKARVDGNGGNIVVNIGNAIAYVTVQNLEIFNGLLRGVAKTTASSVPDAAAYVYVRNCKIHDINGNGSVSNGVAIYGLGNEVTGCEIYNIGVDGVFGTSDNCVISNNRIHNVDLDTSILTGDCIQLSNSDNFIVRNNYLDHTNSIEKQTFICQSGTGGDFSFNFVKGPVYVSGGVSPMKTVYVGNSGVTVHGNYVENGQFGIWCDGASCIITSNVVNVPNEGLSAGIAVRANGITTRNNTVVNNGVGFGIESNSNFTSTVITNNIVQRATRGIKSGSSGATVSHNVYDGCTQNHVDLSNNSKALGTNDLVASAILDPRYKPTNLVLASAGSNVSGTDFYGQTFRGQAVGAVDMGPNGFQAIFKSTEARGNSEDFHGKKRNR